MVAIENVRKEKYHSVLVFVDVYSDLGRGIQLFPGVSSLQQPDPVGSVLWAFEDDVGSVTRVLGSGRGLKGYADIHRRHTTIMVIMVVCGGGLLACLITGGDTSC